MSHKKSRRDVYAFYRKTLARPDLTETEIDEMRKNLGLIAQAICEHVWGKKLN